MSKPFNTDEAGVAIGGFDPVAYFNGSATEGSTSVTAVHEGVTYQFVNEDNRNQFMSDPARYAPQYGGHCATAMSEGKLFEVDPTNFKVSDDRLFLFYRGEAGDTLPEWIADEANRLASADDHWNKDTYVEHE